MTKTVFFFLKVKQECNSCQKFAWMQTLFGRCSFSKKKKRKRKKKNKETKKKNKTRQKEKKLPTLKVNQLLRKWDFADDRKFCFNGERAKLNLTSKLLFQNFFHWLKMWACKFRGTFIKNVLYFSISQKLIIELSLGIQTPLSPEQF